MKKYVMTFVYSLLLAKSSTVRCLENLWTQQAGFYLEADYLFWKTVESQTDFAVETNGSAPFFPTMATGNLRYPSFSMQSGVRVAGGVRFRPNFWEVIGVYTYLSPSGSQTAPLGTQGNVYATYGTSNLSDITAASARIDMTYQVADLLLGKRWNFTDSLQARFLLGPSGLFVTQDVDFNYLGTSLTNTIFGREDFRFSGIGLRIGFDADWHYQYGLGLKAALSFAPIFGNYRHKMDSYLDLTGSSTTAITVAKFHEQRMITQAQILLGPTWGRKWRDVGLLLFVGWELNHLWNLQETYRGLISTAGSNTYPAFYTEGLVGFQGLTASFTVNF